MYVCGVTPCDFSHARAYVAFDVLYRILMAALDHLMAPLRAINNNLSDLIEEAAAKTRTTEEETAETTGRIRSLA
ncbi:hypothetical protein GUJ93_ZPchr0012g20124 [Zizania palustris]|uniref:Uncharacterized protein n=1 Tax=Zizania palustris TaxID=103762 RepID=A0A8J6BSV9_ZIZPA|nr:hypothetical protein GUJ93_ZPchr0012g20124 [Zizania palustris]